MSISPKKKGKGHRPDYDEAEYRFYKKTRHVDETRPLIEILMKAFKAGWNARKP